MADNTQKTLTGKQIAVSKMKRVVKRDAATGAGLFDVSKLKSLGRKYAVVWPENDYGTKDYRLFDDVEAAEVAVSRPYELI